MLTPFAWNSLPGSPGSDTSFPGGFSFQVGSISFLQDLPGHDLYPSVSAHYGSISLPETFMTIERHCTKNIFNQRHLYSDREPCFMRIRVFLSPFKNFCGFLNPQIFSRRAVRVPFLSITYVWTPRSVDTSADTARNFKTPGIHAFSNSPRDSLPDEVSLLLVYPFLPRPDSFFP